MTKALSLRNIETKVNGEAGGLHYISSANMTDALGFPEEIL